MKTTFALALLALVMAAPEASADAKFDRRLTSSEMAKLLPLYIASVEEHAATLPSAEDNQILWGAASSVLNPTYYAFKDGKIVGMQSHKIETLIEGLESAVAELKEVSPAQRVEKTSDLLAGFNGAKDAGKITCRLGYFSEFKGENERIVKCEDNRSQAGEGEDEGYYDVRRFILSIDGKTLEPVSPLRLEHLIAG